MEIEYQTTKKDYTDFNKLYAKERLRKISWAAILLIGIAAMNFGEKPFNLEKFLIGTSVVVIAVFALFYFLPLYRSNIVLNRLLKKDPSGTGKRKLTFVDQGLMIESEDKTTTWNWESIVSVHSNELFIYLVLVDKRYYPFSRRIFNSENDATNFMGLVQNKLKGITRRPNIKDACISKKPSYLLGLLCVIPGFGAIAGVFLLALGIATYRGKWFVIMGTAGMLFNIFFCYSLFYSNIFGLQSAMVPIVKQQLNSVMKDVEFYKLKNGCYPDSLGQLGEESSPLIFDPLCNGSLTANKYEFNYQKIGNHYYLFSSGIDRIPNTKDDIYPQVAKSDSAKFGLIRKSN